jgi:hypothetical protein
MLGLTNYARICWGKKEIAYVVEVRLVAFLYSIVYIYTYIYISISKHNCEVKAGSTSSAEVYGKLLY